MKRRTRPTPGRAIRIAALSLGVLIAATGCAAGTASEPESSAKSGELSELAARLPQAVLDRGYIANSAAVGAAPFEYEDDDGELTGIDIELADRLSEVIDFPIRTTDSGSFEALVPGVQTGRADIAWSAALDKVERQDIVDIVDYFRTGSTFAVLADSGFDDVEDLCGQTVVTDEGSNFPSQLETISAEVCESAGRDPFTIMALPGGAQLFQELTIGRAQARFGSSDFNSYTMVQSPDTYAVIGDMYMPGYYGVLVNSDDPALADVIKEGLQMMVDDGSYGEILADYGMESAALDEITINAVTK